MRCGADRGDGAAGAADRLQLLALPPPRRALTYYRPDQVRIAEGPGATVPYVQGDRTLAMHHCPTCGCVTHWSSLTGADRMAVNARLIEERDIEGVRVRRFDGAETWRYLD